MVNLIDKQQDNSFVTTEMDRFTNWCHKNFLHLNTKKTKEVIVDFGRKKHDHTRLVIDGDTVERVKEYKYLGTMIDCDLTWKSNIQRISDRANKRMYFLRKVRSFNVDRPTMRRFFDSTILSTITFSMQGWYGNLTDELSNKLSHICSTADRIIKDNNKSKLEDIYLKRTVNLAKRMVANANHPLNPCFSSLRSGRRLRSIRTHTERLRKSFVPCAIRLLNDEQK